jgi:hypothetical protein
MHASTVWRRASRGFICSLLCAIQTRGWSVTSSSNSQCFPHGEHDEDVDALSQLLVYCWRRRSTSPEMIGTMLCGKR